MIVLDTHTLIWWVNNDKQLSSAATKAIKKELNDKNGQILISAISAWEIAMLQDKGRISLTMDIDDWLSTVSSIENVEFYPIDTKLSVQSVRLPGNFHPDPADRLIVALARHFSAPLITADKKIQNYEHVKTIW